MSGIAQKLKRLPASLALLLAAFITLAAAPALPAPLAAQSLFEAVAPLDQLSSESLADADSADPPDADDPPAPARSAKLAALRRHAHLSPVTGRSCPSRRCAPYRARAPPLA